jgi:beta-galactosidase
VTGSKDGAKLTEYTLTTAGAAAKIAAKADRTEVVADGKAISQVEFDIVDAQGVRVPNAENALTFALDGPGKILGIGNGNISDTASNAGPQYKAYQGRGLVIVQAGTTPGPVTLKVTGEGLEPATVVVAGK